MTDDAPAPGRGRRRGAKDVLMPIKSKPGTTEGKGPAVDAGGGPVIDPTENVKALVDAGLQRQDDLREMESRHVRELMEAGERLVELRSRYERELRMAETARIDAIRMVDVSAVGRAAEVSAQQASTLAAQVSASADALRTNVATVASATATALSQALAPITKSIEDLRAAQYQQQGQQAQKVEGTDRYQWIITILVGLAGVAITWIVAHH